MIASNDATPFEAPDPAWLTPLFPGYSIECLIATGGMGAVYMAVQKSLERRVAIKILPREFCQDQEFRTNFVTEAKTMARLNHPNLIGVYDFGEVDGMLFIVMEFVPGNTLFHAAHGRAIAADEAARIVTGVCQALAHAHEHGILHRDIKPGNILLDQQARPKIGDFGLARPVNAAFRDGEKIFGTPDYTAPEVIHDPNSVDARADIFSVGVILHELLTGRLPAADPRFPSLICGCDPRFDLIVRRATHPTPALRYAKATDMARDITAATTRTGRAHAAPPVVGCRSLPARSLPVITPSRSDNTGGRIAWVAVTAAVVISTLFVVLLNPTPPPKNVDKAPPVVTPPQPEPKPEPKPAPISRPVQQNTTPKPEVVIALPKPEPEPVKEDPSPVVKPVPQPIPTFDAPGFLDKARTITRQRAAPFLTAHAREIEKNFAAFERRVKRELRDLEKNTRGFVETRTLENLEKWRNDGNRVPKSMILPDAARGHGPGHGPGRRPGGPGGGREDHIKGFSDALKDIHANYLAKQKVIDNQLEANMLKLCKSTYVLGLSNQIKRLTDPSEAPSVQLLQSEIDAVQASVDYFITHMRGIDPNAAKAAPMDNNNNN